MHKGTVKTRVGRFSERNRIYHVTTCTRNREPLFSSLVLGRRVVQAIMCEEARGDVSTLAFVVMPDHLHWLVRLESDMELSDSVRVVKSHSSRNINRLLGCKRKIWQRGFYDRAVRKEEDLLGIARYILANPLRAGIARSVRDYSLWDAVWI